MPQGRLVRSGEFVIAGQFDFANGLRAGRANRISWAPLFNAAVMPPLLIEGRNLSGSDSIRTRVVSVAQVGNYFPRDRAKAAPSGTHEYFYPSSISLPSRGSWMLVATSGPNWGCVILNVH